MIVPDGDERVLLVDGLEVGVRAVLRIAGAVVGEDQGFVGGLDVAAEAGVATEAVAPVFIDVVAEVEDGSEVFAFGDARVGVEVALGVVGARHDAEAQVIDPTFREGARSADGGFLIEGVEAVVVGAAGGERGHVDLDRVVAFRPRHGGAAGRNEAHVRIGGDFEVHGDCPGRARGRSDAGPQDDAVVERVAAGNAVEEGRHGVRRGDESRSGARRKTANRAQGEGGETRRGSEEIAA